MSETRELTCINCPLGCALTVTIDDDTTAVRPRWLVVGDSYYWPWQYGLPLEQMFDSHHYWYYGNTVYNDPLHSNVNEVDMIRELLSTDVVMLLYSPSNLYNLNRDFLTKALLAFYYEEGVVDAKIETIKQEIKSSPEWYATIEQEALACGNDVEVVLEEKAQYVLMSIPGQYFKEFNKLEAPSCRSSHVAKVQSSLRDSVHIEYRRQIYNNQEWLDDIREKARDKGISLDEAIDRDIDWMLQIQ